MADRRGGGGEVNGKEANRVKKVVQRPWKQGKQCYTEGHLSLVVGCGVGYC